MGSFLPHVSVAASRTVVRRASHSARSGLGRSLLFGGIRLPCVCPQSFSRGRLFGVPAGLLEEIGWMGYAFPKMRSQEDAFAPSILLGLLWASWHLPVINYLGTATPHGAYWYAFFLAFTVAMTATRVLICWIYTALSGKRLQELEAARVRRC